MKVALCLSGQPRSVEQAYPFIYTNIIEPNDPDIYVHAWVDDNIRGGLPIAAGGAVASPTIPDNVDDIILDLYTPKDYIFEEQIEFDEKNYNERKAPQIKPKYSQSQWYSVKKAFSLIAEKYDVIIRMRFDWAIKVRMDMQYYDMSVVTCPNDCPHHHGINDQFAFGNHDNMMVYSKLYDHIDDIYNKQRVRYCDEQLLYQHLMNHNITMSPTPIPYTIVRYGGSDIQTTGHSGDFL